MLFELTALIAYAHGVFYTRRLRAFQERVYVSIQTRVYKWFPRYVFLHRY